MAADLDDSDVLEGAGPLRVQRNDLLGRYLACSREVRAGELLLSESALVLGPASDVLEPLCLTCFRRLPRPPPLCPRCTAAPLCPGCQHDNAHPGPGECAWLRSRPEGTPSPPLVTNSRLVMAIRCLLLRRSDQSRWERVVRLEAHEEARRTAGDLQEAREQVLKVLQASKLLADEEDEALVDRVCGIVDVNTFEVRGRTGIGAGMEEPVRLRALFPTAALLAHACLPSALVAVDEEGVLHVRAARPLEPSEPVTLCYANPLQCTYDRREHLRLGKYFECRCDRCVDPTELGVRVGGVRCPRCRDGDLLPTDDPHRAPNFCCSACPHSSPPQLARTAHAFARDLVTEAVASGDERTMEALLARLRRSFPPLAGPALDLRQALMARYRERLQCEVRPPRALLRRQAELCAEMLPALDALCPPLAREPALARYEQHAALAALARREHAADSADAVALVRGLRAAEEPLAAAVRALLLEPARSPEGRLAKMAVAQLRELRKDIQQAEAEAEAQEATVAEIRKRRERRLDAPTRAAAAAAAVSVSDAKESVTEKKKHRRGGRRKPQQATAEP